MKSSVNTITVKQNGTKSSKNFQEKNPNEIYIAFDIDEVTVLRSLPSSNFEEGILFFTLRYV